MFILLFYLHVYHNFNCRQLWPLSLLPLLCFSEKNLAFCLSEMKTCSELFFPRLSPYVSICDLETNPSHLTFSALMLFLPVISSLIYFPLLLVFYFFAYPWTNLMSSCSAPKHKVKPHNNSKKPYIGKSMANWSSLQSA